MTNYSEAPENTKPSSADIDVGRCRFMLGVYGYMASGQALSGIVAYVAAQWGIYALLLKLPLLLWGVVLAPLALALFLSFDVEKISRGAAQVAFWAYAILIGLSLSGIFVIYAETSIARIFFIGSATFLGLSLHGYVTRADLTDLGTFLGMGLTGIVIASLVNTFVASSVLQLAISLIGIIVFVGLTAYDKQRIKNIYLGSDSALVGGKRAIIGALALYLDFMNPFGILLRIAGNRRN